MKTPLQRASARFAAIETIATDRRRALAVLALAGVSGLARAAAVLPTANALPEELTAALAKGQPLVVMASLPGCPFCEAVRNGYLGPMHERAGLPVVQVDMGSPHALRDWQGHASTHADMLRAWRIRVAPTLLFFGRDGREVAPRLVGASIPDFYGAYLEERLDTARKAIR